MAIKKVRVIGDQHGRTNWQQLVEPFNEEIMYVFVGDYTDPYYGWEQVTYEQLVDQINKVFEFKCNHPDNVILLYGNHDLQYVLGYGGTNRFERIPDRQRELIKLFEDNESLFHGIAYQVGGKYLITHAGVTWAWYTKRCEHDKENVGKESLEDVCKHINDLWNMPSQANYNKELFDFGHNATRFSDSCGNDVNHSPLWVRPYYLWSGNLLGFGSGKIQVIGHTVFQTVKDNNYEPLNRIATMGTIKVPATGKEIDSGSYILDGMDKCMEVNNNPEHVDIIMVDCLRRETACVDINIDTLEWSKYSVGEDVMKLEDIL